MTIVTWDRFVVGSGNPDAARRARPVVAIGIHRPGLGAEGRDDGEADPEGDVGEMDLVHIAAVPSGVVAACEKVRKVDTYRLISFQPFCPQ